MVRLGLAHLWFLPLTVSVRNDSFCFKAQNSTSHTVVGRGPGGGAILASLVISILDAFPASLPCARNIMVFPILYQACSLYAAPTEV